MLFDMAGTTVDDRLTGSSMVVDAFINAFANSGIDINPELVNRYRGKQKSQAVRDILNMSVLGNTSVDQELAGEIYARFILNLKNNVNNMKEIDGTTEVFRFLKGKGIKVGVGSGFPEELVDTIVSNLGWRESNLVDYVKSAESIGAGRPNPKMIYDMMECFGVTNPHEVVKVGDTVVDIQEGKNAGAWTVAVLTGSQSEEQLKSVNPDYIIKSVKDIPSLLP